MGAENNNDRDLGRLHGLVEALTSQVSRLASTVQDAQATINDLQVQRYQQDASMKAIAAAASAAHTIAQEAQSDLVVIKREVLFVRRLLWLASVLFAAGTTLWAQLRDFIRTP